MALTNPDQSMRDREVHFNDVETGMDVASRLHPTAAEAHRPADLELALTLKEVDQGVMLPGCDWNFMS